jgi:predicted RNA binding protein YcfA (HicA-like mRNA interferase family)
MRPRRLPALAADDVVRALERAGFRVHRIKGSHHHLRNPE